jgi:hypothetical protein
MQLKSLHSLEAVPLGGNMPRKGQPCIDPEIGKLLDDFCAGLFEEGSRPEDRSRFTEHLIKCESCRSAAVDHVVQTETIPGLLQRYADEKGISFENLIGGMTEASQNLHRIAQERGLNFDEVVREFVGRAEARRRSSKS